MIRLDKGKWLGHEQRPLVAEQLAQRYRQGASIRALAAEIGRSYGFVQALLTEAGVALRPRGGARVRRSAPGRVAAEPASVEHSQPAVSDKPAKKHKHSKDEAKHGKGRDKPAKKSKKKSGKKSKKHKKKHDG